MPRNVSGVYSLPSGSSITNGDFSDAADLNAPLEDLKNDQNAARPIVAGGTGATTASVARTNLGLVPGTDIQGLNANLTSLAGLTLAADKGLYATGADTVALFDLTAAGLALLDDADADAQRATLGLGDLATRSILDEDDFSSNSPLRPPSQQSVAVYVAAAFEHDYESADTAVTLLSKTTFAHGLSVVPDRFELLLKCETADAPYVVGEVLKAPSSHQLSSSEYNTSVSATSTEIIVRTGAQISVVNDSGAVKNLTVANWRYVVRAWIL